MTKQNTSPISELWAQLLKLYLERVPQPHRTREYDSELTLAGGHFLHAAGLKGGKVLLFDGLQSMSDFYAEHIKIRSASIWNERRVYNLCDRIQSTLFDECLGRQVSFGDVAGEAELSAEVSRINLIHAIGGAFVRQARNASLGLGTYDNYKLPENLSAKFRPTELLLRLLGRRAATVGDLHLPEFSMEGLLRMTLLSPWLGLCGKDLLVCRPPAVWHLDPLDRFHNPEGAAVWFQDGTQLGMVSGVDVPMKYFNDPASIEAEDILDEANQEVRRIMLEQKGIDAFLKEGKFVECAHDDYGRLYKTPENSDAIRYWHTPERECFVRLLNSTPEPGTTDEFKEYLLRVPPEMQSPREAVAWSFDLDESDYAPAQQT